MTATIEDIGIDLPPMNVVKCTCDIGCVFAGPCPEDATVGEDDELFCDDCREANKKFREEKARYSNIFGWPPFASRMKAYHNMKEILMGHCHACDLSRIEEERS
jgi:hypothetical protein